MIGTIHQYHHLLEIKRPFCLFLLHAESFLLFRDLKLAHGIVKVGAHRPLLLDFHRAEPLINGQLLVGKLKYKKRKSNGI
jgi:hypothetical protein